MQDVPSVVVKARGVWGRGISLNAKICVAATLLVILSLGITSAVIGFKASTAAETATMNLARTAAREAVIAVQSRLRTNLATVITNGATVAWTLAANRPLQREQLDEMSKATLASEDIIDSGISMEPNGLDGKDADYAG
ncbi:MAG: methyl-accepting chemotaxis protein, partial [Rhodoferax sp.]|nr:methyl-accepting chemotaxis protein [Rhodoferax sp.]